MTIALPSQKSKPTLDIGSLSVLLYGFPKSGKSTFASKFPGALFFECEPGLGSLEVYKVPTYTWPDFLEACRLVAAGDHPFKTVIIDTADNAFRFCSEAVCQKYKVEYEGDVPHGKAWVLIKNEWHRVLTKLASLPLGLVIISHATDKTIQTRTGEYTKTVPTLPERARGVVMGLVDMILYADIAAVKDEKGNLVQRRVLHTKPHVNYEAGDRTGRMPETLALDFDEFQKAFARGKGDRSPDRDAGRSGTPAPSATPAATNGKDRK